MTRSTAGTVVVTGAANGMGLACTRRFLADGKNVVMLDVNAESLAKAAQELAPWGERIRWREVDVTDELQLASTAEYVSSELGPATVLVNAAGILRSTPFESITRAEWDLVMNVSVTGSFLTSRTFLPQLRAAGEGRIVNFSSTAGKTVSTLGGAHYTAAKSALLGLTRALAKEVAGDGITVNAVCPGLIDTEMVRSTVTPTQRLALASSFPINRLGKADEVASLVAFLSSNEAGYITGAALDINGGDLMV